MTVFNAREIAEKAWQSLYSRDVLAQKEFIREFYNDTTGFSDPIIDARGPQEALAQFKFLRAFSAVKATPSLITVHWDLHSGVHHVCVDGNLLIGCNARGYIFNNR